MSEAPARPRSILLAPRDGSLAVSVVRFCRVLRSWGVRLHAGSSQMALRALREIDPTHREDFRTALQVALLDRPEDFALYTYLFNAFFRVGRWRNEAPANEGLSNRPVDARRLGRDVMDEDPQERGAGGFQRLGSAVARVDGDAGGDDLRVARAAAHGMRRGAPGDGEELHRADLERLARALSDELATRPSRRRVRDPLGRLADPRGTLRQSLRFGGVPVELRWKRRRVARTRLLLFCDVSRSMDEQAAFLVDFAAAVLRRLWRVEVFLFASELVRVNDLWLDKSWQERKRLVPDCGGGTQIGACLDRFLRDYDRSLLGSGTIVMVLSDGLDAGDPAQLAAAMERLARRAHAVIWLNPLLRLEGYEPRARGMTAALPHVDLFAAAHDLDSMWGLVRAIRSMAAGRRRGGLLRQPGGEPERGAAA